MRPWERSGDADGEEGGEAGCSNTDTKASSANASTSSSTAATRGPRRNGGVVAEGRGSSPMSAATINLSREYTLAIHTSSYHEIWAKIHVEVDGQRVDGGAGGDEEEEDRSTLAGVLRPEDAVVERALGDAPDTELTRLAADYLRSTHHASELCLSLRRALRRARALYGPITDLLALIPQAPPYAPPHCDCAFDAFLLFDQMPNPFPDRQSSMDPNRRRYRSQSPVGLAEELTVPDNLDATMQLLFLACHGNATGVEVLLRGGVDVNNINLDGRTTMHIAACEGHPDVVRVLLNWKAKIDARDRWGSTAAADAKCYGHTKIYNLLKSRGAKIPVSFYKNYPFHLRNRRTSMTVSNPGEIPEYELNPETSVQERIYDAGEKVTEQKANRVSIKQGTYQVAKWNGTKVSVKILDRESYSDQESM